MRRLFSMRVIGIQEFCMKQEWESDSKILLLCWYQFFVFWIRFWSLSVLSWMYYICQKDLVLRRPRNLVDSSSRRTDLCRDRRPSMNHPHELIACANPVIPSKMAIFKVKPTSPGSKRNSTKIVVEERASIIPLNKDTDTIFFISHRFGHQIYQNTPCPTVCIAINANRWSMFDVVQWKQVR